MNYVKTTSGDRIKRSILDRKIREAKAKLIQQQLDDYSYNFCTICKRNDCLPLDCSHHISVKEAIETGRSELCWDLDNMAVVGRSCHKIKDSNLIMSC
ncbi:MAG: hypothetical protein PF487_05455 [Bacteroidales bacterium]|jgi:hypothetical protein|nr:hypothetical protein [Bacteroidales bacterium]